ncbi:MAG: hypothetical protein AVDCRST_MAG24-1890, partial [uncultured Nocardioidaceae bacterium]
EPATGAGAAGQGRPGRPGREACGALAGGGQRGQRGPAGAGRGDPPGVRRPDRPPRADAPRVAADTRRL